MEQTKVELSRLKLLCERNEVEKQELAQQSVDFPLFLDLKIHLCVGFEILELFP